MQEPTFKQHKILEKIASVGTLFRKGDEDDIDDIYELVRAGYVKNLVCMSGGYDWKFINTEKADEYLIAVG